MGNINHLRLVATGGYVGATALATEFWQMGINLLPTLTLPDDIHDNSTGAFDAASATLSSSGTGYTVSSNYLCEGGANDINPDDYLVNQAKPAFTNFLASGGGVSHFCTIAELRSLELYAVGSDGHVVDVPSGPSKATLLWTTTPRGGSGGKPVPLQDSVAVSWVTAANTPRGRGRIFTAGVSSAILDVDGTVASASRATLATAGAALISGLRLGTTVGPFVRPVVMGNPWSTAYVIKRARVGSIFDTQKRRTNALTEVYSAADVT